LFTELFFWLALPVSRDILAWLLVSPPPAQQSEAPRSEQGADRQYKRNNKMDECMTQMKAASDAMKKQ
jgi:hypothetical protein